MSFKHLFSRSLTAVPERLHFAAHSHHLWPDAAFEGHAEAAEDAAFLADHKWDKVFGEVLPSVKNDVAQELNLPDPETVTFATNTHELIIRMASCFPIDQPLRILTTDGEFHSLSRQAKRWEQAGSAKIHCVPVEPFSTFQDRFMGAVSAGEFDWVFLSHVFFGSGHVVPDLSALAGVLSARAEWLIIDGYHSFMALPVDFSSLADRAFFLSGGYKYAMAGEGACFLHAPPNYGPHPVNTGWYAAFGVLAEHQGNDVPYALNASRFAGATFDPSGLYRFRAIRDHLYKEGLTTGRISSHVKALQDQFVDAVQRGQAGELAEAELIANPTCKDRARFLAYRHPDTAQWNNALSAAGVVTDVRGDTIRFGFGLYHDPEDVERLIKQCARLLGKRAT